jgi:atypical dual specificity phosphatase
MLIIWCFCFFQVTVNSGGVVYFAMFRNSLVESGNDGSEGEENKSEAAAVFKFGSSRLATQSERLGIEIARHLGVATPQVLKSSRKHCLMSCF